MATHSSILLPGESHGERSLEGCNQSMGREEWDTPKQLNSSSSGLVTEVALLLPLLLSRFSHVRLCATPWTVAHQAPPSTGFSRQEHWSGLHFLLQAGTCGRLNWSSSRPSLSPGHETLCYTLS